MMDTTYKPGDVIVFEKDDHPLSQVIAFLTDSNVSHAALMYDSEYIVEMTRKYGIKKTKLTDYGGRPFHSMRHTTQTDMKPVIDAVDVYLEKHIPFDNFALYMLGGLLIYHKYVPTPEYKAIVNTILAIACIALDTFLKDIDNGKKNGAMMCSQLVHQCFCDADGDYRLKITNGAVWGERQPNSEPRLIDLLKAAKDLPEYQAEDYEAGVIDEEEIARKLYEALASHEAKGNTSPAIDAELKRILSKTHKFLDLVENILEAIGSKIPVPSLFVTPADLYCHTENIKEIGATPKR